MYGGGGVESDVSILSALEVYKAIDKRKYNVRLIYISKDNHFYVDKSLIDLDIYKKNKFKKEVYFFKDKKGNLNYKQINSFMKSQTIDVIIPVCHGAGYEDGKVSAFFEMLGSLVAMPDYQVLGLLQDKVYTKNILKDNSINVLDGYLVNEYDFLNNNIKNYLDYPVIIKPATLGSSVGISIAQNESKLREGLFKAFKYDKRVLVEKALTSFREFSIAILGYNTYQLSSVEEVVSKEFYSYENKYLNNQKKIYEKDIEDDIVRNIKNLALKIAKIFNICGVVRIDFLLDNLTNTLYVNEINSIPGSLSYPLFENKNILFYEVIDIIISSSIRKRNEKRHLLSIVESNILKEENVKK